MIEEIECFVQREPVLPGKLFDNPGVFLLEQDWICSHIDSLPL